MRLPKITLPSFKTMRLLHVIAAVVCGGLAVDCVIEGRPGLAALDGFLSGFNLAAAIFATLLLRASEAIDELRTLNEFMHELNGQMLALCRERFVRLPDDVESPRPPRYH